MQEQRFSTLLYRYFFFAWLFRDVSRGNAFERAAAMRYNREQARWLPVYLLRWMWWGLGFYAAGEFAALAMQAPTLATLCYAASSMSIPISLSIAVAWVGLRMRWQRMS